MTSHNLQNFQDVLPSLQDEETHCQRHFLSQLRGHVPLHLQKWHLCDNNHLQDLNLGRCVEAEIFGNFRLLRKLTGLISLLWLTIIFKGISPSSWLNIFHGNL